MRLKAFDLIAFDLDGVLIDSRPQMEQVFRECYRLFGSGGEPPVEQFFASMGMPLPDILRKLHLPPEAAAHYCALSRKLYKQIKVVPHCRASLHSLWATGIPLGVITGKDRTRTLEILGHFDLLRYFKSVVCGDDQYAGKPAPDGLIALARRCSTRIESTLLIGDSILDVECGLRAGAVTAAARWGFEPASRLATSGAQHFFDSLTQFTSWLLAPEVISQVIESFQGVVICANSSSL